MRIGLDYRPALINREGIGRYTRELVRELQQIGADRLGLFGWTLAGRRVPAEELGLASAQLSRVRFPSRWLPRLCRVLGRGADDLVGGAELWHHTQPSSVPVRAALEVATVFDCIYLRDEGFLSTAAAESMRSSVQGLIERSRLVLVPSEFVARDVQQGFGLARERLVVTHLGCDHVLRHAPREREPVKQPFLLTVARVDPRKNHLRILAAFERIAAAGFPHRWIIAGPPGHRAAELEEALARSPARDRIEWHRGAGEAELARWYSSCSAFLFPSLDEGFGLPPLEAMALGAPVIASNSGSLPEVLGQAALLVDPLDVDALFERTRAVLSEPELAAQLARAGREHARGFTWRACARATRAAYERALSAAPSAPSSVG